MIKTLPKTEPRTRLTLDDVLIVDLDVHAHDTPEGLAPYMDSEWREVVEAFHEVSHRYLDLPGYSPFNSPYGAKLPGAIASMPRGGSRIEIAWTAEQMRRELDQFFIDIAIVFPDYHLRIGGLPNVSY